MQEQNEPGAVITPGATASFAPQPAPGAAVPEPILPPPQPFLPTQPSQENAPIPSSSIASEPSNEAYSVAPMPSQVEEFTDQEGVFMTWQTQALEEHAKQSSWYIGVTFVAIALTVVVFFLTGKDVFASVAVFLAVLCFAYLGSHKPKDQQYALAQEGIYVGDKLRPYEEFKNFSEVEDASGPTVILIPHKRFASPLVLKLTQNTIDEAVDTLAHFLPIEERKPDAVDQLVRRIKL